MAFRSISDQIGVETDTGSARHFEANDAVTKGQVVELDTDDSGRTVEPCDADGAEAYGVAAYSASSGEQVLVYGPGCVVRATSGTGSVTPGLVATHGNGGEVGEIAQAASGDNVFGIALEDDAGTNDDAIIEVLPGAQQN